MVSRARTYTPLVIAAFALAACGDDSTAGTDTASGSTAASTTNGSATATTSGTASASATMTGSGSNGETSGTSTSTTDATTSGSTTDNPTSSTTAVDPTTGDTSTTTSTTGDTDTDSTTGDPPFFGEIPETCDQAELSKSTVGCLFYGIDMDSHDLAENGQYAIAVANVQENQMATVTIERKQGGVWSTIAGPAMLPALDLGTYNLPAQNTDDSMVGVGFAYRVKSDVPVIAYQFNPVDGQSSFLSDAAMLYPVSAWDSINHAITYTSTTDNTNTAQRSYASAVAFADNTKVTVTPSVPTKAGNGVPAGQPGVPFDIVLNEGDVLSVAINNVGTSLSGTIFESPKEQPIALFAGIECALIPTNVCCCDHVEEQISGVRLWGKHFVGARMPVRNPTSPETTLWQLYGAEDDTTVTLDADAAVTGLPANPIKLNKGQIVEFFAGGTVAEPGDFEINADKPIGVMNYMTGSENMPAPYTQTGDPASVQIPSVEQFLPRYVVLVPGTWVNDVGVFVRQGGAQIAIDGVTIPDASFNPVGKSGFEVARVPLTDGVHFLDGMGMPFGVTIVGYDQWDSYAYLGGTGTKIVNPNPQ
ncbi:MAG: IgGFc-binding protein [Myxococcales bacterium]|nr:IgGFc-binding protein [Myxococcales bacterium]MCB9568817.1 IgGFc-binding protein [Myxococcales bacterium]MCB9704821.1 IgGFc-binding protein [Myxococcales bacterium]